MSLTSQAFINAIGCAVPDNEVHRDFIHWAEQQIDDPRKRAIFRRMADRSGIERRWSVLDRPPGGGSPVASGGFYEGDSPATSERMLFYAEAAPKLALQAIEALRATASLDGITHLVVASCTGFAAPGIDQIIAEALGLQDVERILVGFMGCYAAITALRTARHIVRSEPSARVLVITVELSTLHLQYEQDLERLLAMLQFSDGAAAALVSADQRGFQLGSSFAICLPRSSELIRWSIGDTGFEMHLSGEVAARIGAALQDDHVRERLFDAQPREEVDCWAVHAGGRSILDAVERGLELEPDALAASREVLANYGNMSSSTVMFVLAALLRDPQHRRGTALAFGPGVAAEGFHFERAS
jgi:predicted naringenin-chalcone synthase